MMIGLEHFLAMGGYADYVWSAYGIAAVVLLGNIIYTPILNRKILTKIHRYLRIENESQTKK